MGTWTDWIFFNMNSSPHYATAEIEGLFGIYVGKAIDRRTLHSIERIAARMEPALRSAFLAAVKSAKSNATLEVLERALRTFDPAAAIRAASDGLEFGAMQETLAQIVESAGIVATENLRPLTGQFLAHFDLMNPYARLYARRDTAELVREITLSTKEGIRTIVERSFLEGIPPRDTAKQIREIIGLTEFQSNSVMNYRARLIDQDVSNIDGKVQRYADKVLRDRAFTIARTETLDSSNAGAQAAWNSAVDQGFLPADVEQEWIITEGDERTCEICAPMPEMPENQHVKLSDTFVTGDGQIVRRPPAHPRCRCSVALRLQ